MTQHTIWHTPRQHADSLALIVTDPDGREQVWYTEACYTYATRYVQTQMTMIGWDAWRIVPVFDCPACGAGAMVECDLFCPERPDAQTSPVLCWCRWCEAERG